MKRGIVTHEKTNNFLWVGLLVFMIGFCIYWIIGEHYIDAFLLIFGMIFPVYILVRGYFSFPLGEKIYLIEIPKKLKNKVEVRYI